jgi:hypothetical protein
MKYQDAVYDMLDRVGSRFDDLQDERMEHMRIVVNGYEDRNLGWEIAPKTPKARQLLREIYREIRRNHRVQRSFGKQINMLNRTNWRKRRIHVTSRPDRYSY